RGELRLEPAMARVDLHRVRLRVEAPLAAWLPLEVLHRVRDVDVVLRDACLLERGVEDPPRGSDERMALLILLIARLLADEHEPRVRRAFAEDRLRGVLVQMAR